jgi:signal transduction histidine kinase/ActR/RegA family two-component response regulator
MLTLYDTMVRHHDARLVVLAVGVCLLASYTTFSMMARLYAPRSRYPWVIAASIVTGCGAWATHSLAVLAFQPGVPIAYDVGMTVASGLFVVLGCGLGFYVARTGERMALGGAIVGFAIGAMHYAGMTAVTFQAQLHENIFYSEASVLTAATFGAAALLRAHLTPDLRGRIFGAVLLTVGICGAHFIDIAGLTIIPDTTIVIRQDTLAIVWFAIALTAVVLLILGFGIVGNLVDQHIQHLESARTDLEVALAHAQDANHAKSEFLANMSHELRTPLNAVIGFSEVIAREMFGAVGHKNYKEYAKDIYDSGSHLLQIINDILDISKAEAGELKLAEGIVDCQELIAASCRLIGPRVKKSELTLATNLPNRLPRLRADGRMVKQIILNLLTNAVKFTPPGGRIGIEVTADDQHGLVIGIRDTGIGIAKADLDRVRQPFVQVDGSLSRRHEGTGLGLPLVDMMMTKHGGSFELDSELGKGTTARLRFPPDRLVWAGSPQSDDTAEPAGAGAQEPDTGGTGGPKIATPSGSSFDRPRLLVVEDDRNFCEILQRMLERAGFATAGVYNGRDALCHLTTQPVDLVITDIAMPEMDGIELMRALQRERPNLPVITVSGLEDIMGYHQIATHLGASATLLKPLSKVDLICAVNDALGRGRSHELPGIDLAESA